MESSFDQAMDDVIVQGAGVTGVLCTDNLGLCLGVRGKACFSSSGIIANIANTVSQIEPSNSEEPVILLESSNLQCTIQKQGNISLAIFKSQPPSSTAGFVTSSELLTVSVGELSTKTGLSVAEAGRLIEAAALQYTPPYTTGWRLMQLNEDSNSTSHIKTGCTKMDKVLGGGIPCSGITEIAGESGTGKTQLALQLALQCQLPTNLGGLGKAVAYICTEMQFPVTRLNQLIDFRRRRGQQTFNGKDFTDNIHIHHLNDMDNLVDCVRYQLTHLVSQKGISLIVLDSVAAVFRASAERQQLKSKMTQELGYRLHQLSTLQKVTVVAINQVKANFGNFGQTLEDDITPALGLAWANLVTTRIMLRKTFFVLGRPSDLSQASGEDWNLNRQEISSEPQRKIRCLEVIFCPWLPGKSSPFTVTEEGIEDVDTSLIRVSDE